MTDEEILSLFRSGDQNAAFQALVTTHGKAVYNIALFTLNDDILAEDASQDAFVKIYRNLHKFEGSSKLSTWMYRIVKNVCYDHLKKRRTEPMDEYAEARLVDEDAYSPEQAYIRDTKHNRVRQAVGRLPEGQRMAISLYYFQHAQYDEIAEIMGQPLGTIKSYIHRAKGALGKMLAPMENEER